MDLRPPQAELSRSRETPLAQRSAATCPVDQSDSRPLQPQSEDEAPPVHSSKPPDRSKGRLLGDRSSSPPPESTFAPARRVLGTHATLKVRQMGSVRNQS